MEKQKDWKLVSFSEVLGAGYNGTKEQNEIINEMMDMGRTFNHNAFISAEQSVSPENITQLKLLLKQKTPGLKMNHKELARIISKEKPQNLRNTLRESELITSETSYLIKEDGDGVGNILADYKPEQKEAFFKFIRFAQTPREVSIFLRRYKNPLNKDYKKFFENALTLLAEKKITTSDFLDSFRYIDEV